MMTVSRSPNLINTALHANAASKKGDQIDTMIYCLLSSSFDDNILKCRQRTTEKEFINYWRRAGALVCFLFLFILSELSYCNLLKVYLRTYRKLEAYLSWLERRG